jgi:hypothetical protein
MSGLIVIIDTSDIRQGGLADAKAGMTELARSVNAANRARSPATSIWTSAAPQSPSSRSNRTPLPPSTTWRPAFSGFADLLVLRGIEVAEQRAQADK